MFIVQEIKKITKGRLIQGEALTVITGVSIDSRTTKKGNVFIAIKGERFDGHRFVQAALRKGAVAVITSKDIVCPKKIAVIYVEDTTKALGQIAGWHRNQFDIPVIAITGSVGKTTVKEMIAAVLGVRFKVLKNTKTENNQYGVPLTLLKLNSSHQIAVLELGTNQPGDIRWLAKIVQPTTAVFTNIGDSHLERLKSQRGVFREKSQLVNHMRPHGRVIFNNDDPYLKTLPKLCRGKEAVRFGCGSSAEYKASHITIRNDHRIQFKVRGAFFTVNSPAIHNVYNALAAISCGRAYKIRYNDISTALARFKCGDARQELKRVGKFWLIDDTYNANPTSFKSAISTLNALHVKGKRIVVGADMLELGSRSKALHQSVGRMIAQADIDVVLTTGQQARYITQGFNRLNGHVKAVHCNDLKEVHQRLKSLCCSGDAVLVKGSRGMRMERTIKFLKEKLGNLS